MKGFDAVRYFAVIVGTAIGLAAEVFMLLTFYTEAFLHHGMLFIEPNLAIATGEFFSVIFGMLCTVWIFHRITERETP